MGSTNAKGRAAAPDDRLTLDIDEAARLLGVSRAAAYQAAHDGWLPVVKLGRRLLVPKARLDALLAGGQPARATKA